MKYFRKHPDLLIIASYPNGGHRIRHGRLTTPQQLSSILVHTITKTLSPSKKMLLLTDTSDEKKHTGLITRTAWAVGKPQSLFQLVNRVIYNHEMRTVCILIHPELFGRMTTALVIPWLILFLRLLGKRVMTVFLTVPRISVMPTIAQTVRYFASVAWISLVSSLSSVITVGEPSYAKRLNRLTGKKTILTIPMTIRTLKERRGAGVLLARELFPSPIRGLGLINMRENSSLT